MPRQSLLTDNRKKVSLSTMAMIYIALVLVFSCFVLVEALWSYSRLQSLVIDGNKRELQAFSDGVAAGLSDAIVRSDYSDLESQARLAMANKNVRSMIVADSHGKVLLNIQRLAGQSELKLSFETARIDLKNQRDTKPVSAKLGEGLVVFWSPVNASNPLGWLRLEVSNAEALTLIKISGKVVLIKSLVVIFIFLIVFSWLVIYVRKMIAKNHHDLLSRNLELHDAAHLDGLTKIPNRLLFKQRMNALIMLRTKSKEPFAVCFFDLDDFKAVNDTFGHRLGDEVLIEVSKRLIRALRSHDTVARLGGDEFVLLLPHVGSDAGFKKLLDRIVQVIRSPYLIQGQLVEIGLSLGVTICPPDQYSAEILLQHADQAMYQAKTGGRNQWVIYEAKP